MLSKKQKAYMNVARYMASKSEEKNRHGAVVVKSGRVLGMGYNKIKNHPHVIMEGRHKFDCGPHAEVEAIKDAGKHAKGATLFVARVNKNGEDRLSKPCVNCQKYIEESEIKNVIYTY